MSDKNVLTIQKLFGKTSVVADIYNELLKMGNLVEFKFFTKPIRNVRIYVQLSSGSGTATFILGASIVDNQKFVLFGIILNGDPASLKKLEMTERDAIQIFRHRRLDNKNLDVMSYDIYATMKDLSKLDGTIFYDKITYNLTGGGKIPLLILSS